MCEEISQIVFQKKWIKYDQERFAFYDLYKPMRSSWYGLNGLRWQRRRN